MPAITVKCLRMRFLSRAIPTFFMATRHWLRGAALDVPDDVILTETRENKDALEKAFSYRGKEHLLVAQRGHMFIMQYATFIPMETVWKDRNRAQLGFYQGFCQGALPRENGRREGR